MYWKLYYKDISVLIQRYSVVPLDNKNKDDEYKICHRPSLCRVSFPGQQ